MRAPQVVVACGALESPALLLRSGIGGPAVGRYLRLHPCTAIVGHYGTETQRPGGARRRPALVDEFANVEDGYGFLIECAQYATGIAARGDAVRLGRRAQADDGRLPRTAPRSSGSSATTATAG